MKEVYFKKGNSILCERNSIKYAWIEEHKMSFNITLMCKVLQVDRSSYYHWIKNGCIVHKIDEKLHELIELIFLQSRQTYGTRRIKDVLVQHYGVIVSRRSIKRILEYLGLSVKMKRRYKVMTTLES